MMIEAAAPIITGALLGARAVGAKDIAIAIEDNKPRAIDVLKKAAAGTGIKIAVLKTKYPQGSEKQLIMAVSKRGCALRRSAHECGGGREQRWYRRGCGPGRIKWQAADPSGCQHHRWRYCQSKIIFWWPSEHRFGN